MFLNQRLGSYSRRRTSGGRTDDDITRLMNTSRYTYTCTQYAVFYIMCTYVCACAVGRSCFLSCRGHIIKHYILYYTTQEFIMIPQIVGLSIPAGWLWISLIVPNIIYHKRVQNCLYHIFSKLRILLLVF